MKKIIEFIKKYKIQILILLVLVFFFRSCSKTIKVNRLEKEKKENTHTIDSLKYINDSVITLIPSETNILLNKLKVEYNTYDLILNEMSRRQITCGNFREEFILKPKEAIGKEIKSLEK